MPVTDLEMQGYEKPETVTIDAKRWHGLRRQLVRLVLGFRYTDKEIARILEACRHASGCPAVADRTVPCLRECPDREIHLSALVIKHNAEAYSLLQRGLPLRPDGEYHPPSRETYDAVVSELEALREVQDLLSRLENLATAGEDTRMPSPWNDPYTVHTSSADRPIARLVSAGHEDADLDAEGDAGDDTGDTDRPPPDSAEDTDPDSEPPLNEETPT